MHIYGRLLVLGEYLPCSRRWGWGLFDAWNASEQLVISGYSEVLCKVSTSQSALCRFRNSILDFSKVINGGYRTFREGFLTTFGDIEPGPFSSVNINAVGKKHLTTFDASDTECDMTIRKPVFVLSNDDIYNLGHYINDVMAIWSMLTMWGVDPSDAILLNFDGLRDTGPAGGFHQFMEKEDPDKHGPYAAYYESWFSQLMKASDFKSNRVCFSDLYFMPNPSVAWFWNDWGQVSECTLIASSPLYQSFNAFLLSRWQMKYGRFDPPADPSIVHVVIEVRSIDAAKQDGNSVARHISNVEDLVRALRRSKGVQVTAQDFAKLLFRDQVR